MLPSSSFMYPKPDSNGDDTYENAAEVKYIIGDSGDVVYTEAINMRDITEAGLQLYWPDGTASVSAITLQATNHPNPDNIADDSVWWDDVSSPSITGPAGTAEGTELTDIDDWPYAWLRLKITFNANSSKLAAYLALKQQR